MMMVLLVATTNYWFDFELLEIMLGVFIFRTPFYNGKNDFRVDFRSNCARIYSFAYHFNLSFLRIEVAYIHLVVKPMITLSTKKEPEPRVTLVWLEDPW
jgi:hypothetical protein